MTFQQMARGTEDNGSLEQMREYGFSIIKVCAEQDIEAEEAPGKH